MWPDVGRNLATLTKSGPKSSRQKFLVFSKEPKKFPNVWATFARKFVAETHLQGYPVNGTYRSQLKLYEINLFMKKSEAKCYIQVIRPGYFQLQLSECMMETYMLLAGGVRVHEHCWPQLKPIGWEWGFKNMLPGDFVRNTKRPPAPLGKGVVPGDGGQCLRLLIAVHYDHDRKWHCPQLEEQRRTSGCGHRIKCTLS